MKARQKRLAGACAFVFALQSVVMPAWAQMVTPGSFAVSELGAATYSVPIGLPPGIAGVVPQLSLAYSSQSGNGIMGVGWSLSGLSSITRCPATMTQDGVRGTVRYNLSDRYCLDGQRLMVVTGTYGADKTEYRTEQDTISKIVSYGSAGTGGQGGPAYFVVQTKAGLTMKYGATADSAIEAQGQSVIRAWALSSVSDTKGNYMNMAYTEDWGNGQYQVSQIDYTGNTVTGLAPINHVYFDYETRPDIRSMYQAGSLMKNTKRLTRVWSTTTMTNSSGTSTPEFGEVRIQYESATSPATSRSRVSSIQTCDGAVSNTSAKCLPAIKLTWSGATPTYKYSQGNLTWTDTVTGQTNKTISFGTAGTYQTITGDFNLDGLTDFIQALGADYYVFLASSAGGFTGKHYVFPNGWGIGNPVSRQLLVGDFNGDGLTDFMEAGGTNYFIMKANGDGSFSPMPGEPTAGYTFANGYDIGSGFPKLYPGDWNGDGYTDFFAWKGTNASSTGQMFLADGKGAFTTKGAINYVSALLASAGVTTTPSFVQLGIDNKVTDLDGDGALDFITYFTGGGKGQVMLKGDGAGNFVATPTGITDKAPLPGMAPNPVTGVYSFVMTNPLLDVNGDGLPDWGNLKTTTGSGVLINTGSMTASNFVFGANVATGSGVSASNSSYDTNVLNLLGDINGDGLTDAIVISNDHAVTPNGQYVTQVGAGDGTFKWTTTALPAGSVKSRSWTEYHAGSGTTATYYTMDSIVTSGDFDGDGRVDFMSINGSSYYLFTAATDVPDLVTKIETGVGLGTSVGLTYKPLPQMGANYVRELTPTYPKAVVTPGLNVVRQTDMANGLNGGLHTVTYRYGTALSDLVTGRGFLGFNWTEHTDGPSGLISRTYYRQDWPFLGRIDRTAEYTSTATWTGSAQGNPVLSNPGGYFKQQVNSYTCVDNSVPNSAPLPACTVAPGKRFLVYTSLVKTSAQDLDGSALPGEQTVQTIDGWANPLTVTSTTLDGTGAATSYSKTTTNTYANDTTNWFLGRLLRSTVTAVSP